MRELTLIGLDVDGKHLICEGGDPSDKFLIRLDDRLRAAARGERSRPGQNPRQRGQRRAATQGHSGPYPRGASVQEVAASSEWTSRRWSASPTRFCWSASGPPRLATAAHPVLADGPAVETRCWKPSTPPLTDRGLGNVDTTWDAWRTEDGRWTIRMGWNAGLSRTSLTSGSLPERTVEPSPRSTRRPVS